MHKHYPFRNWKIIMPQYISVGDAALVMAIPYQTLISRIRRKRIPSVKMGYCVFIPLEEVRRHAHNENLVETTRKIFLPSHSEEGINRGS